MSASVSMMSRGANPSVSESSSGTIAPTLEIGIDTQSPAHAMGHAVGPTDSEAAGTDLAAVTALLRASYMTLPHFPTHTATTNPTHCPGAPATTEVATATPASLLVVRSCGLPSVDFVVEFVHSGTTRISSIQTMQFGRTYTDFTCIQTIGIIRPPSRW